MGSRGAMLKVGFELSNAGLDSGEKFNKKDFRGSIFFEQRDNI